MLWTTQPHRAHTIVLLPKTITTHDMSRRDHERSKKATPIFLEMTLRDDPPRSFALAQNQNHKMSMPLMPPCRPTICLNSLPASSCSALINGSEKKEHAMNQTRRHLRTVQIYELAGIHSVLPIYTDSKKYGAKWRQGPTIAKRLTCFEPSST